MKKKTFTFKSIAYNRGYNSAAELDPICPFNAGTVEETEWLLGLGDGIRDIEIKQKGEQERPSRKFGGKYQDEDSYEDLSDDDKDGYYPDVEY